MADVFAHLRTSPGRRLGRWFRGLGIALLLIAAFAPLPGIAVAALAVPGVVLFSVGGLAWIARDAESWRR